jgi:hypothetical protein
MASFDTELIIKKCFIGVFAEYEERELQFFIRVYIYFEILLGLAPLILGFG